MKNNKIKPSILPGFMELLPREQKIFNDIMRKITKVYEENGCLPMDTPIIEKSEVLLAKTSGETEKQVYTFKRGNNDLTLRFDLTVPFARFAAQNFNELTFPFKRYQIGKVYRGERNQKGRYREFYQCDVDIIGNNKLNINNDALVIYMASEAFRSIGLSGYKFQLSNRKILSSILKEMDILNANEVMILIDKYDKIGEEEFCDELSNLVGEEKSRKINELINLKGDNSEIISKLKRLEINEDKYKEGIDELEKVIDMLSALGVDKYVINLKIIRGLDYYTGTVFETFLEGNESYGSICSGGRYDNLAENYTDNILPGVGISIGLTRLFFVLMEIGFVDNYIIEGLVDYLIIPIGDTMKYCTVIYKKLKADGKSVEIYFEDDKLKKKLNYANKLGVQKVVLVGEEEMLKDEIKIKDMITGSEEILKL